MEQEKYIYIICILCWYNCLYHVQVQLFVSCPVSCVINITMRRIASSSDALTKLTRHNTNNCTHTFIHIIRLSSIFIWQKMVILLGFINIFTFSINNILRFKIVLYFTDVMPQHLFKCFIHQSLSLSEYTTVDLRFKWGGNFGLRCNF